LRDGGVRISLFQLFTAFFIIDDPPSERIGTIVSFLCRRFSTLPAEETSPLCSRRFFGGRRLFHYLLKPFFSWFIPSLPNAPSPVPMLKIHGVRRGKFRYPGVMIAFFFFFPLISSPWGAGIHALNFPHRSTGCHWGGPIFCPPPPPLFPFPLPPPSRFKVP